MILIQFNIAVFTFSFSKLDVLNEVIVLVKLNPSAGPIIQSLSRRCFLDFLYDFCIYFETLFGTTHRGAGSGVVGGGRFAHEADAPPVTYYRTRFTKEEVIAVIGIKSAQKGVIGTKQ